jgi:hypothetical protein
MEGTSELYCAGAYSLDVLLLREVLGVQAWALQQLTPFAVAGSQAGSTRPASSTSPGVQWPLLSTMAGSSSSSSSGGSSSSSTTTTTSSSSSSGTVCSCNTPTCYLSAPPPLVTLQQLRLVLEVVCLTCTKTTSAASRAPLLLALLLQRASGDARAAFLNSADGVRLLVALQHMCAYASEVEMVVCAVVGPTWWWARGGGALSALGATPECSMPATLLRAWPGASWS